jgi:hypothetical protein
VASGWRRKRPAEPSAVSGGSQFQNSQESEQIKSGPLLRLLLPPEDSPVEAKSRFEQKYDHPNRDAYVSAKAEIALGRDHHTESNQIKPNQTCGMDKNSMFRVQDIKFNAPNTKRGGEGKTKMTTHSEKVHLFDGDYDYVLIMKAGEGRRDACQSNPVKPSQTRSTANGRE